MRAIWPPRTLANSTKISAFYGVFLGADTMRGCDFAGRIGWWLVTSEAIILSRFYSREVSIEALWSNKGPL